MYIEDEIITKIPNIITICSGKGGVGKSFLSANIAYSLSRNEQSVLLVDADNDFPNQHLILGVEPPVRIQEVISGKFSIQNALFPYSDYLCLLAGLPASGGSDNIIKDKLTDCISEIFSESLFDNIIFDTPAGINEHVLNCCKISNIICIVITDEPTSLLDAYGLIKILLNHVEPNKIKILVNNVIDFEDAEDISSKLSLATENFLKIKFDFIGFVPYDRIVRQSIVKQELLLKYESECEVSQSINKLTERFSSILV